MKRITCMYLLVSLKMYTIIIIFPKSIMQLVQNQEALN